MQKSDDPIGTKEAARYLGYSESALKLWRGGLKVWQPGNKGPKFTENNGRYWYCKRWLDEWKESIWAKVKEVPEI